MPRMPAVKAVTSVQEVVETHLEARVPRGEAAEAILDSWHEQVTVAAQLRQVKTAARLPSWTLAPIKFYLKKTINSLRLAAVVCWAERRFSVWSNRRGHTWWAVLKSTGSRLVKLVALPLNSIRPKHRPCSDQTTDFVMTFADWWHLVAENWQHNYAGERAAHRSLGLRWWNASVCSVKGTSVWTCYQNQNQLYWPSLCIPNREFDCGLIFVLST